MVNAWRRIANIAPRHKGAVEKNCEYSETKGRAHIPTYVGIDELIVRRHKSRGMMSLEKVLVDGRMVYEEQDSVYMDGNADKNDCDSKGR